MAQYYSRSQVYFAATSTSGALQGFLLPRPTSCIPVALPKQSQGLSIRIATDDVLSILRYREFQTWQSKILKQPLQTRSWTFQERLFARRILHITAWKIKHPALNNVRFDHPRMIFDHVPVGESPASTATTVSGMGKHKTFPGCDISISVSL